MTKLAERLAQRGGDAARAAYEKAETRFLVAQGRKAVKQKVGTVKRVGKKAAKTGLIVGTLAAVGVVVREVRKRRRD